MCLLRLDGPVGVKLHHVLVRCSPSLRACDCRVRRSQGGSGSGATHQGTGGSYKPSFSFNSSALRCIKPCGRGPLQRPEPPVRGWKSDGTVSALSPARGPGAAAPRTKVSWAFANTNDNHRRRTWAQRRVHDHRADARAPVGLPRWHVEALGVELEVVDEGLHGLLHGRTAGGGHLGRESAGVCVGPQGVSDRRRGAGPPNLSRESPSPDSKQMYALCGSPDVTRFRCIRLQVTSHHTV